MALQSTKGNIYKIQLVAVEKHHAKERDFITGRKTDFRRETVFIRLSRNYNSEEFLTLSYLYSDYIKKFNSIKNVPDLHDRMLKAAYLLIKDKNVEAMVYEFHDELWEDLRNSPLNDNGELVELRDHNTDFSRMKDV